MSDKVCVEPLEIDDYEDRYMASTNSSDEEFSDIIESVHRDAKLEEEYEKLLREERLKDAKLEAEYIAVGSDS